MKQSLATHNGASAIRTNARTFFFSSLYLSTRTQTELPPSATWPIEEIPSPLPPAPQDTSPDDPNAMEAGLERSRQVQSVLHRGHRDNLHATAKTLAVPTPAPSSFASAHGCPHRSNPSSIPTQTSAATPNFTAFRPPSCSPAAIRR